MDLNMTVDIAGNLGVYHRWVPRHTSYTVDERVNKRSTRQAIKQNKTKHELQHDLGTIVDYQHCHILQNNIF